MDITPYIGTIVTVIIAVGATYAAISSRLTKLETKIEDNQMHVDAEIVNLRHEQERYNNARERTFGLEATAAVHEQRIAANEARIKKLEEGL